MYSMEENEEVKKETEIDYYKRKIENLIGDATESQIKLIFIYANALINK